MNTSKTVAETERLSLEEVVPGDWAFIVRLVNSPTWLKFIGDRGIRNEEDAKEYIRQSLISNYRNKGYGLYKMVLKEEKAAVGLCGFLKRDYLEHADLGFAVLPGYEGKGLTFEAAKEMVEYGKSALKLDPILAITTSENIKSRRLLNKLGFHHIGEVISDEDEKLVLFSTNPDSTAPAGSA